MDDLLFAVVIATIFFAATVIVLALCGFLYRDLQVPSPLRLLLASFERFRGIAQSSLPLFMRTLQKELSSAYTLTPRGARVASGYLTCRMAPEDIANLDREGVLRDLAWRIAEAYESIAGRRGWSGLPAVLEIYFVEDLACQPNRPRVRTGRPGGAITVHPQTVVLGSPHFDAVQEPVEAQDSGEKRLGGLDATTPMPPRHMRAPESGKPTASASGPQATGSAGVPTAVAVDIEATATCKERALLVREGRIECRITDLGVKIGRDNRNDLVVRDPSVSRHHAALNYRDGQLVLEPVEGRLCWVNDVSVAGPTMVQLGDRLRFSASPSSYCVEAGRE